MLKKICAIFLFSSAFIVFAQNTQNGWNIYTSMKDVNGVGLSGNNAWAATTGGLFTFDMANTSRMTKFTTLDGLLSNELSSSIIDLNGNIWAGALDGSISVYYPNTKTWKVITDIENSGKPNKRINNFFQYGNNMFIGSEFCIVKFSISQFQFVDQPYIFYIQNRIEAPANWIHIVNDTIWVGTDYGIAYANVNSSLPIQTSWRNLTTTNSVLKTNVINSIAYFNNRVFFATDSGMVYFQNNSLQNFEPLFNGQPIRGADKLLAAGNSLYFNSHEGTERIYRVNVSNLGEATEVYSGNAVNSFKVDANGDLIVGTKYRGVDIFRNSTHTSIFPNGPYSNLILSAGADKNSNLWAVSGPLGFWENESGVYKFNGTFWKNFVLPEYPELGGGCCGYATIFPSFDGSKVWIGSLGNGLLKIENDHLTRYTEFNSILKGYGNPNFVIAFTQYEDNNGKLWVCNSGSHSPFVNFTDSVAYPVPIGGSESYFFTRMTIDNYNTKWSILHNNDQNFPARGAFYFNEKVPSARLMPYGELGDGVNAVNDIITDKNGEIWIATDNGITVFPDPSQAINNPNSLPYHFKMRMVENGISTPLTEHVTTLAVDALNNKWIGTFSNGLLYVSPDGSTLLARYNNANSPLPDNRINGIGIDSKSGATYFGTAKGLVSLKTIAIDPLEECSDIIAGPNPYIIPNSNLLRIDGLVAESTVKILTISGTLIAEFETAGGRVTNWNGKDLYGNYVSSGIYIIVGFNKDGSKVCTGKFAVVRK